MASDTSSATDHSSLTKPDNEWADEVTVDAPVHEDEEQAVPLAGKLVKPGSISFPLRGGARVDMRWSGSLTEKQWTQFEAYLVTLKMGIVEDDDD